MPEAAGEIVIARPPNEVFEFLSNPANDLLWRAGVIELKRASGSGVGARYAQTVKGPGGRRIAADIEITEFVPDEKIAFQTTSGPVRPSGRYLLARDGNGTRVRFELAAKVSGLKRLMAPMVQKTMQSEIGQLDRL